MKVGYFSDLHTEFLKTDAQVEKNRHVSRYDARQYGIETFSKMLAEAYAEADVIVAAGDIGKREQGINFMITGAMSITRTFRSCAKQRQDRPYVSA